MTKQALFQYASIWHPTEKEVKDNGTKPKVVVDVTTTVKGNASTSMVGLTNS